MTKVEYSINYLKGADLEVNELVKKSQNAQQSAKSFQPKSRVRRQYNPDDINIAKLFLAIREHRTDSPQLNKISEIKRLLLNIQNINDIDLNDNGNTALHVAVGKGHKDIVEFLLNKDGIEVNIKNNISKTPMDIAKSLDNQDIVEVLEEHIRSNLKASINEELAIQQSGDNEAKQGSSSQISRINQEQPRAADNDYSKINDRLEKFIGYFVKEFEAKLHSYHMILQGKVQKAGKFSDTFSGKIGQEVGGGMGSLIGLFLASPTAGARIGATVGKGIGEGIGSRLGMTHRAKKVANLLDLIDHAQKDKSSFRQELVEIGFDVFQSFEMQFMRVTTNLGPEKAMQELAQDAVNRAISHIKSNKDTSISESIILGESKIESVLGVPILLMKTPGFEVQYKYKSNEQKWSTASLYGKAGLMVIESGTSNPLYYKKKDQTSRTGKYGYRRLLKEENWGGLKDKYDSDNPAESGSGQFTDYQYNLDPQTSAGNLQSILNHLNDKDEKLGEERIKEIIQEVKDNILEEIKVLKKQSCESNVEDHEILVNIENSLANLEIEQYLGKFKQDLEEAKKERQEIANSLAEGRQENREGLERVGQRLNEIESVLVKKQGTQTESVISGLGITKYYYIPRILHYSKEIKENFQEKPYSFFVTSSSRLDKSKLQENQDIVLISDMSENFEELREKYKNRNIHWLKKDEESKFIWQSSHGSLSNLRMFIDTDQKPQKKNVINRITDIKDRIVIITSEPGMGKSTMLTHLAVEQKKASSSVKVIRVNLNDHTAALSKANFENINSVVEFLNRITEIKDLQGLKDSILLFDGFDEVAFNTDYKGKVMKLVNFLKNEVKNLWITTRPYSRYDLENELSVFSYTLERLSELNQKEFLEKFWKTNFTYSIIKELTINIGNEIIDERIKTLADKIFKITELEIVELQNDDDNLREIKNLTSEFNPSKKAELVKKIADLIDKQLGKQYKISKKIKDIVEKINNDCNLGEIKNLVQERATSCAENLIAKFSKSIVDKERNFTGVPLEIRMLAEAFQEEFYEDFKKIYDLEPDQSNFDRPKLPERLSLLDLYERFIKNKHKIYFVEKSGLKESIEKEYDNSRKVFIEEHRLLALSFFLSEEDLKNFLSEAEKDKIKELKENIKLGKENTGIVYEIINDKPRFIHHTFAEYFAAGFFVDMIKKSEKSKLTLDFINYNIFKVKNEVTCNFFDLMLAEESKIHIATLNNDKEKVKTLLERDKSIIDATDIAERTALHLAAAYGYKDVVQILQEQGASINTCEIFNWMPLDYAYKSNNWNIVEFLLTKGANYDSMLEAIKSANNVDDKGVILLHIAAQEGYIEFAKVLVEQGNVNVNAEDKYGNTPLYLAIQQGKLEIVEYLIDRKGVDFNDLDKNGRAPLHLAAFFGNLELVKYLIDKKEVNLNVLDNNDGTPLHLAAFSGNLELVKYLIDGRVENWRASLGFGG